MTMGNLRPSNLIIAMQLKVTLGNHCNNDYDDHNDSIIKVDLTCSTNLISDL